MRLKAEVKGLRPPASRRLHFNQCLRQHVKCHLPTPSNRSSLRHGRRPRRRISYSISCSVLGARRLAASVVDAGGGRLLQHALPRPSVANRIIHHTHTHTQRVTVTASSQRRACTHGRLIVDFPNALHTLCYRVKPPWYKQLALIGGPTRVKSGPACSGTIHQRAG